MLKKFAFLILIIIILTGCSHTPINNRSIPEYSGTIKHAHASASAFLNFLFENKHNIVYIDVDKEEEYQDEFDGNSVVGKSFLKDYFVVRDKCYGDDVGEHLNCTGGHISINYAEKGDGSARIFRGTLKVEGYFAVVTIEGPYQGYLGYLIRPVKIEDALKHGH